MNPDKNMQIIAVSLGELSPITFPVRRMLDVPVWENLAKYPLWKANKFYQTVLVEFVIYIHSGE